MTIMERRKEGSKENRGSCEGDRGFIAKGGGRREYFSVLTGGRWSR